MRLEDVPTPGLLLDLDRLERNLATMARRAAALGVRLRPHAKTHKCVEIAARQRDLGAQGLTVATLEEARAFADAGFDDVTWALPVPLGRIGQARALAETVRLGLLVDSMEAVDRLESEGFPFAVWLKIDCGYHRAGVDPQRPESETLARRLAQHPLLRFEGILTHSGQAYEVASPRELPAVAESERAAMAATAARWRRTGIRVDTVSVGSTPAMSAVRHLDGIDEVRPGNYALYDGTQVRLGSCALGDCAVSVLATVVSSPRGAAHSVVDAGALALSKDAGHAIDRSGGSLGGVWADHAAAVLDPALHLVALSQEHGRLSIRLPVGDLVRILPHHSCLAVACFDRFHLVRGDEVIGAWSIHRGR